MSKNNMFIELQSGDSAPYRVYAKTIPAAVTGWRLDPKDLSTTLEFVLSSSSNIFDYETDAIELYSAKEDDYFLRANRRLFSEGTLRPHLKTRRDEVVSDNFVDDEKIQSIAAIVDYAELEESISHYTSPITLLRIFRVCVEKNMPRALLMVIEKKIKSLDMDPAKRSSIENSIAALTSTGYY